MSSQRGGFWCFSSLENSPRPGARLFCGPLMRPFSCSISFFFDLTNCRFSSTFSVFTLCNHCVAWGTVSHPRAPQPVYSFLRPWLDDGAAGLLPPTTAPHSFLLPYGCCSRCVLVCGFDFVFSDQRQTSFPTLPTGTPPLPPSVARLEPCGEDV